MSLFAMLHDIGKVGINDSILQKPGALTDAEWLEMKKHPEIGFRIAQNNVDLAPISEYILSHHERWDGGGYPRGLKGEEILLEARIVAVADVVESMGSHRPYRAALGIEPALPKTTGCPAIADWVDTVTIGITPMACATAAPASSMPAPQVVVVQ